MYKNYYKILGLNEDASLDTIKSTYRRRAQKNRVNRNQQRAYDTPSSTHQAIPAKPKKSAVKVN